MKKLILLALLAGYSHCYAQKHRKTGSEFQATEHISKKFTLQQAAKSSVFALHNIWGDVKVQGYNGNEVVIEIDQTIMADDADALANAKRDVKLGFDQTADSVIAYTVAPYDTRPNHNHRNDRNNQLHYIVKLDYTVKVPNGINLSVATVNDGDMAVKDVYGNLKVRNVNGPISIINAKNTTDAITVNGDVIVNYLALPAADCNYHTINGKIEVSYPEKLSANVQFKSMNGEFFTDFDNAEAMPAEVIKSEEKRNNSRTFRLNKNTRVRINGGNDNRVLKFETLNGNIYLKKS